MKEVVEVVEVFVVAVVEVIVVAVFIVVIIIELIELDGVVIDSDCNTDAVELFVGFDVAVLDKWDFHLILKGWLYVKDWLGLQWFFLKSSEKDYWVIVNSSTADVDFVSLSVVKTSVGTIELLTESFGVFPVSTYNGESI